MGSIRLRTKFLLSLLTISAGLTSATLLIVRYSVRKQIRAGIQQDLRNSVGTYQSFERQRQETLIRSAELLANLPNVRALMTTKDEPTIQDGRPDVRRQSGSDLLVMAGRAGEVMGLQTAGKSLERPMVKEFLQRSLAKQEPRDWWFGDGHLYEVWIQPIYFGASSANTTLGFLVVGHEIDQRAALDFSNIAASEVAFYSDNHLVASTLTAGQQAALGDDLRSRSPGAAGVPQEIKLERNNTWQPR